MNPAKHTLAISTLLTVASSAAVIIANPGFELPAHTANDGTNPTGWTVVETTAGTNADRQVRTRNQNPHSGEMTVQLGAGNSNHTGELYQTVATAVGQQYTFSIWGVAALDNAQITNENFTVDLLSGTGLGGASLASVTSGGTLLSPTYTEYTVNFTATTTDTTIWIRDTSSAVAADGNDVWLDDVSITAIPEPSSALLSGLATLALLRRRRS